MKRLIKTYAFYTASLYLISRFCAGMIFEKGSESLFLAGAGLTLVSLIAKPLLNLLLLPINLITFGLFRWVSSAIALYLVTLLVPGFKIINFSFAGLITPWVNIPPINLAGIFAYIAFSFLLSILVTTFLWLTK
jgi:putative membrane protein